MSGDTEGVRAVQEEMRSWGGPRHLQREALEQTSSGQCQWGVEGNEGDDRAKFIWSSCGQEPGPCHWAQPGEWWGWFFLLCPPTVNCWTVQKKTQPANHRRHRGGTEWHVIPPKAKVLQWCNRLLTIVDKWSVFYSILRSYHVYVHTLKQWDVALLFDICHSYLAGFMLPA